MMSPAGQTLGLDATDFGRGDLLSRRSDEIDETERKRREATQASGYSPAGMAAFGLLSVAKGAGQ
jgi:hypothetical protein